MCFCQQKRRSLVNDLEKGGPRSGSSSREGTPKKEGSAGGRRKGVLHYQLQVVDTTLLKCYLQVTSSENYFIVRDVA